MTARRVVVVLAAVWVTLAVACSLAGAPGIVAATIGALAATWALLGMILAADPEWESVHRQKAEMDCLGEPREVRR